jgi:hypothetical protein
VITPAPAAETLYHHATVTCLLTIVLLNDNRTIYIPRANDPREIVQFPFDRTICFVRSATSLPLISNILREKATGLQNSKTTVQPGY